MKLSFSLKIMLGSCSTISIQKCYKVIIVLWCVLTFFAGISCSFKYTIDVSFEITSCSCSVLTFFTGKFMLTLKMSSEITCCSCSVTTFTTGKCYSLMLTHNVSSETTCCRCSVLTLFSWIVEDFSLWNLNIYLNSYIFY